MSLFISVLKKQKQNKQKQNKRTSYICTNSKIFAKSSW